MATKVNKVVNKTDAELVVVNKAKKSTEEVPPHSKKSLTDENLLDLTFISQTKRSIYIQIKSITEDGSVGNGDEVEVVAGDPEGEEI